MVSPELNMVSPELNDSFSMVAERLREGLPPL